jgi:hypothetical protein
VNGAAPAKAEPGAESAGLFATGSLPRYFKAGVYERWWESTGSAEGRCFHAITKSIASVLIGRAEYRRRYRCVVTDAQLVDRLGVDDKTIRKYLKPLIDSGLVGKRLIAGARKEYDLLPLFQRYGEEKPETSNTIAQLGKHSPPEKSDEGADLAQQIGLSGLQGFERELEAIVAHVREWERGKRFVRWLVKRYGITKTSDAVGYVAFQMRHVAGGVKDPIGLLLHAIEKGYAHELVPWSESEPPQVGNVSPPVTTRPPLDEAIWNWIEQRFPGAFAKVFRGGVVVHVEDGRLRIACRDGFHVNAVTQRANQFAQAARAILGDELEVIVEEQPMEAMS